jgi:hypothetical protein
MKGRVWVWFKAAFQPARKSALFIIAKCRNQILNEVPLNYVAATPELDAKAPSQLFKITERETSRVIDAPRNFNPPAFGYTP